MDGMVSCPPALYEEALTTAARPDLGMGWRFQVPYLVSLGFQVIVPDMLGYGQTSAPDSLGEYTMKKMASHVAAIIKANTSQPVILGGHDWGGIMVWRVAMYHPELIRAVFSFTAPYFPPSPITTTLEQVVQMIPSFRYQFSNRDGAVEAAVGDSRENLEAFLKGAFGATTLKGELPFDIHQGIYPERLAHLGASALLSPEMLAHYVEEYSRHGLRGPCNWYRTTELNSADEAAFVADKPDFKLDIPAMIVMSENDLYLPPILAEGMEAHFTQGLKKAVIAATHWSPVEKPKESNALIKDFVTSILE